MLTPQKVSDFRPIACCNVIYKCISKILTNRIKLALNHIVDDNQSAFVPGRAITDNILLTQELLKGYNCAIGPKRCSFKIDIQKAYDTVCWRYIEDILRRFRDIDISGGRGLRQGDPISPYMFTMVMEMVNLLIKDEIMKDKSFKYHFGCRQLKITHLCFADDLIMLSHGDISSVATHKRALDKFSIISGLYPNLSKCTMFCGSMDDDTKEVISRIFPFKEGKLLVRYFGVLLVTKKIGIADCNQLVEKNIASRKESLCVKWINVVKLKQRSVWDVEIDSKDSWGWKCLLNLRSWVGNHMRYKIGDGKSINVWHDKWNSDVSLSSMIRKKEIFYASFKDQDKIQDVLNDNGWKWPQN
ncbi:RNA-directed DNA polymerase, eukaryota, reverse transcriptase zinc-binding domain protein [Tanacetum coccineum]